MKLSLLVRVVQFQRFSTGASRLCRPDLEWLNSLESVEAKVRAADEVEDVVLGVQRPDNEIERQKRKRYFWSMLNQSKREHRLLTAGRGPVEQNLLTWDSKEQIRYLYRSNPEKWTPKRLSEGFPISEEGVRRLLKSNFHPRTLKQVIYHDQQVLERWRTLRRKGNIGPVNFNGLLIRYGLNPDAVLDKTLRSLLSEKNGQPIRIDKSNYTATTTSSALPLDNEDRWRKVVKEPMEQTIR